VSLKVERQWQSDPDFYDCWNWWRAHLGAEIVRDIRAKAKLRKPLWIFILSWWHGRQHGQDPLMFNDAGVSLLAPMLYQVPNRTHFNIMVKDWNEYLRAGQVNLIPGDQVDFHWHQFTTRPAAPEEMYDRIVTAHTRYERDGLTCGAFWHDINRAIGGNTGPYPGTEWALAGGAAFSTVRCNWKVYPLAAELSAPASAAIGGTFEVTLNLTNVVKTEVRDIQVSLMKTPGIALVGEEPQPVRGIAGGQGHSVPVSVRIKGPDGSRANRFMVALKVTWPEGNYGDTVRDDLPRQIIVMKYVQGQ